MATPSRRSFLSSLAAAGAALPFSALPSVALRASTPKGTGTGPQKILILGGTGFLGPHFVRAALQKGHTLTLFNRGKTNPQLFPGLEKLQGDREKGELSALAGRA